MFTILCIGGINVHSTKRFLSIVLAQLLLLCLIIQPALASSYVLSLAGFSVGEQVRLIGRYTASSDGSGAQYSGLYEYYIIAQILAGSVNPYALRPVDKPWIDGWANASAIQHLNVPVSSISLDLNSALLQEGKTMTLHATVSPSNATDKAVAWSSSNTSVVTVDNGVLSAKRTGTAVITAQAGNFQAHCTVRVVHKIISASKLTISPRTYHISQNNAVKVSAHFTPSNTTDKTLKWASLAPSVATVDANGIISGIRVGTTTVSATTSNGKTASCTVIVRVVNPTGVVLPSKGSVMIGQTKQLAAKILPSNASDKTLRWTSSDDSIASVSQTGLVTAHVIGNVTITVKTVNDKTDICKLRVTPISVQSLSLPQSASLKTGQTLQLAATITPSNATNSSLAWSSSNPLVAGVSPSGVVTATRPGIATITIASGNGKKATCKVRVLLPGLTRITSGAAVDLNSDGKVETIRLSCTAKKLTVKVGSRTATIARLPWDDNTAFTLYIGDIQYQDKFVEIFVRSPYWENMVNQIYNWYVLRYDGKSLKWLRVSRGEAIDNTSIFDYNKFQFFQNGEYYSVQPLPLVDGSGSFSYDTELQFWAWDEEPLFKCTLRLQLSSAGTLVVQSDPTFYPLNGTNFGYYPLQTFHAYTSVDTNSSTFTIGTNTRVYFMKASILGWYQLKTGSGATGYIKLHDHDAVFYPDARKFEDVFNFLDFIDQ